MEFRFYIWFRTAYFFIIIYVILRLFLRLHTNKIDGPHSGLKLTCNLLLLKHVVVPESVLLLSLTLLLQVWNIRFFTYRTYVVLIFYLYVFLFLVSMFVAMWSPCFVTWLSNAIVYLDFNPSPAEPEYILPL